MTLVVEAEVALQLWQVWAHAPAIVRYEMGYPNASPESSAITPARYTSQILYAGVYDIFYITISYSITTLNYKQGL